MEDALPALAEAECRTLGVMDGDHLVGLLTQENLGEFLMIRNALEQARPGAVSRPALGVR